MLRLEDGRWTRKILGVVLAAVIGAALPASAGASTPSGSCGYSTGQVFLPWADSADYWLVPGGDMESSSAWTRTAGAALVAATSPLGSGASSLWLKKRAAATSQLFCVDVDSPTLRFFVKPPAHASARLFVEILYLTDGGKAQTKTIATIKGGATGWQLSPIIELKLDQLAKKDASGTWQGQLRFRAESGQWLVDDVYADPFRRV